MISTLAHLERLSRARKRGTAVEIAQPRVESRAPQFEFDAERALRSPPDPAPILISHTIRLYQGGDSRPARKVRGPERAVRDDGCRYLGEVRPRVWDSKVGAWVYL